MTDNDPTQQYKVYVDPDWPDCEVKYLILKNKDYIVFIDAENDLDWATSDEYDQDPETIKTTQDFNRVKNLIDKVETIPCNDLEDRIVINFKRQVGEALVRALDGDFDNAEDMAERAEEYIKNRNVQKSRYWYLLSSGETVAVFIFLAIVFWLLRTQLIGLVGEIAFFLTESFLVGSLGAYLSIIFRMGKTTLDYNASRKLHFQEGFSRVFAGMISGLFVALCIKCGILFPVFNKVESTHLAMMLGALIAGSSERLAASIIHKVDGKK
jgi:hypothetical protein